MSTEGLDPRDRMMVEGLYWWGVPSLFRCPVDPDPAACDIALVGVPHSSGNGSTERDQHLGPRAVRNVSALQRRYHLEFGLSPWEACRIHDLGDVPLPEANDNEACIERITSFFAAAAKVGTRTVAIGGDHSVTGGIVQGLVGPHSELSGGRKAALLHLDAHIDAYESIPHWFGARKSAAHWASYLVREGQIDPARSVQIGIRGNPRSADWLKPSYDLDYEVIPIQRYRDLGAERCVAIIRERIGDAPLYITFDLDCLDPSIAPAVSNLEPGVSGFTIDEATQLLRAARGLDVIGADVVCLMPSKDQQNQITSLVAAAVMFELISLIADRIGARPVPL
ncbi:MAG: arginase family protein [Gaiellales bacterium]